MKIRFAFFIVLLLSATNVYALSWSGVSTTPSSGVQYSPNLNYNFQITWSGENTVSNVLFESNLSTLSGTLANITTYNLSNDYFVNFTDLPGGNYLYRWYAVDNESNWNSTSQFVYTVDKNNSFTIRLFLNGTEGNRSYKINDTSNFTVFLNLPNKAVYLSSNYPSFTTQTGSSIIHNFTYLASSGLFSLTAYWDGNENYSASSKTYYFGNEPPQYSDKREDPSISTSYFINKKYTFYIRWTDSDLSHVWFESNHTGTLKTYTASSYPSVQNTSNSFNITLSDIPAETFTYRWLANDSLNQIRNTNQNNYYIWKTNPLLLEITPSNKVNNGTETTAKCYSITTEVTASNFKLYRNSILIANDTLYSRKDNQTLDAGTYQYVCNNSETQNFTNQSIKANLTVNLTLNFTGILNLVGPSSLQAEPGETFESNFFLQNNLGYAISNLSLRLTGIDSSWYNIEDIATSIPDNFSLIIRINFNIPADASQGDYNLTLRATFKSPSNETKIATKYSTLSVVLPQQQNFPPVYSPETANTTVNGDIYEFALKWTDDNDLSGYIFSSNITGEWVNDSWVSISGTDIWSYSYKNISVNPGSTISWKFYVNDSNNLWSESQEFNLETTSRASFDFIPIVILLVFVIALATLILFITQKSKGKTAKKEEVTYVYNREDIK